MTQIGFESYSNRIKIKLENESPIALGLSHLIHAQEDHAIMLLCMENKLVHGKWRTKVLGGTRSPSLGGTLNKLHLTLILGLKGEKKEAPPIITHGEKKRFRNGEKRKKVGAKQIKGAAPIES